MPYALPAPSKAPLSSSMPAAVEPSERKPRCCGRRPDRATRRSALYSQANALYHEFEEAGLNRQLGYESPAASSTSIPVLLEQRGAIHSICHSLSQRTANGRQWVANLYSNVFRAERDLFWGATTVPRKTVTVSPASRDGKITSAASPTRSDRIAQKQADDPISAIASQYAVVPDAGTPCARAEDVPLSQKVRASIHARCHRFLDSGSA